MNLTVLMTTYNCAEYIREAIQSILNQTFSEFELLVIDDGSNDNTEDVVNKFIDERIRYIKINHSSRAAALNFALNQVKCQLIAIQDADDISEPERLRTQIDFLNQNKEIGIIGSWALLIEENGTIVSKMRKPLSDNCIKSNLLAMNGISFPTTMWDRGKIDSQCLFNENLSFAEDLDWFYNQSMNTQFANVPKYLIKLRQTKHSLSRNENKNLGNLYGSLNLQIPSKLKDLKIYKRTIRDSALINYYYGDLSKAKEIFIRSLKLNLFDLLSLRYLLPLIIFPSKSIIDSKSKKIFLSLSKFCRELIIFTDYVRVKILWK